MMGGDPLEEALGHARALAQNGDLRGAIRLVEQCTREQAEDRRGWLLGSELWLRAGNGRQALFFAERAAGMGPTDAAVLVQLGRSQAATGDMASARRSADAISALKPAEARVLDGAGAIYSACDEHALALPLFRRAAALAPGNAHFLFNLASALRFAGEFEEAETAADAAIAANPADCGAWHLRSDLRRQTTQRNHVPALEERLARDDVPWQGRVQLCYALAKEYEDLADYERSFAVLSQGAALRRGQMDYDVEQDVRTLDRLVAGYTREALEGLQPGHECTEPIFVLGLPRSGTTLVERILGSHGAVTAAGELRNFPAELLRLAGAGRPGGTPARDELIDLSLELDMRELGQRYVESTRPKTGATPRFTDKMPINFLYCGLIHAALPRAKIIHLTRHPLDACYAMYKTLFSHAYPFSYSLEDLGRYYAAYARLMSHWRAVMPGVIHEVAYEKLVTDAEGEIRRLLDYCGLEFEAACLEFHLNVGASTTASAVQVRRPLYTDSIGRWRRLERQLSPLRRVLESEGIAAA